MFGFNAGVSLTVLPMTAKMALVYLDDKTQGTTPAGVSGHTC